MDTTKGTSQGYAPADGSIMGLWNGEKLSIDHNFISRHHQTAIYPAKDVIKFRVFRFCLRNNSCHTRFGPRPISSANLPVVYYTQRHCKSLLKHKDDIYCTRTAKNVPAKAANKRAHLFNEQKIEYN